MSMVIASMKMAQERAMREIEQEVQRSKEQLAEIGRLLPIKWQWVFDARLLAQTERLCTIFVLKETQGILLFDEDNRNIRYSDDYQGELIVGWILGNVTTNNFLALLKAQGGCSIENGIALPPQLPIMQQA